MFGQSELPTGGSELVRKCLRMVLKEQLKKLLTAEGITLSELSRRSGVPKSSLSDWMSGRSPKNLKQVKSVANCFDVSLDSLCFGEQNLKTVEKTVDLNSILNDGWVTGLFEVKLRRIKK